MGFNPPELQCLPGLVSGLVNAESRRASSSSAPHQR